MSYRKRLGGAHKFQNVSPRQGQLPGGSQHAGGLCAGPSAAPYRRCPGTTVLPCVTWAWPPGCELGWLHDRADQGLTPGIPALLSRTPLPTPVPVLPFVSQPRPALHGPFWHGDPCRLVAGSPAAAGAAVGGRHRAAAVPADGGAAAKGGAAPAARARRRLGGSGTEPCVVDLGP